MGQYWKPVHVDTAVACVFFIGFGLFAHWVMSRYWP